MQPLTDWIGRTEQRTEVIAPAQAAKLCALLDQPERPVEEGAALPPLWHWLYFLPTAPMSALGPDGHPTRGGFLPPVPLPRRMFAGARLKFHAPLTIGRPAVRVGEVIKVAEKQGGGGRLVFVTVRYRIDQDGAPAIEEEQDIVYRAAGAAVPAPVVLPADRMPAVAAGAVIRTVTPDPRLLFRFSALTYNAHRIHYDRPYAVNEEGYPGLVVHGPLTALLLLELAQTLTGAPARRFSFRGRAPLFDLAPFRLVATPESDGAVALEAQGPDGLVAMSAEAAMVATDR